MNATLSRRAEIVSGLCRANNTNLGRSVSKLLREIGNWDSALPRWSLAG
jgi:hypothetical protein